MVFIFAFSPHSLICKKLFVLTQRLLKSCWDMMLDICLSKANINKY